MKKFALIAALGAAMLCFIEGFCSVISVFSRPVAEPAHTRYDEQLGWINQPNLSVPNLYGPGIWFKTNSRSTRNEQEFSASVPRGKIRVICSGDSFTLGYGVNNDEAWCSQLAGLDHRLETVNMGQGGYGVDQSYLWYMRDGTKLRPDVHLFAFTSYDFDRMASASFWGYAKPVLRLVDGRVEASHVPVPKRPALLPWLRKKVHPLQDLALAQMLQRWRNKLAPGVRRRPQDRPELAVALKLFEELATQARASAAALALVYLPTPEDLEDAGGSAGLRDYLRSQAAQRGIPFVDLTSDFARLPPGESSALFQSRSDFLGGAGHYTAAGNRYAAQVLYRSLRGSLVSAGRGR